MGTTPTFEAARQVRRRPFRATIVACLGFVALAAAAVVTAGPANAGAAVGQSTDTRAVGEHTATITFDELNTLIEELGTEGEVTFSGLRRMQTLVGWSEMYHDRGLDSRAVLVLRDFNRVAADPTYVPSDTASAQLIEAGDQLIAQLGGA